MSKRKTIVPESKQEQQAVGSETFESQSEYDFESDVVGEEVSDASSVTDEEFDYSDFEDSESDAEQSSESFISENEEESDFDDDDDEEGLDDSFTNALEDPEEAPEETPEEEPEEDTEENPSAAPTRFSPQSESLSGSSSRNASLPRYRQAGTKEVRTNSIGNIQNALVQKINHLERIRFRKRVVIGTIVSLFDFRSSEMEAELTRMFTRLGAVFASVAIQGYEEFQFVIPFEYLDVYLGKTVLPKTKAEKEECIENSIGAKIAVTITKHIKESNLWVVNRVEANKILRRRYYYSGYRRVRTFAGNYIDMVIKSGTIVSANVFQVRNRSLILSAYGVQFSLSTDKISRLRSGSLKKVYRPGQVIKIQLKEVKKKEDDNYNVEILEAESVELNLDPSIQALDNATINRIYAAVVTGYSLLGGGISGHTIGAINTQFNIKSNIITSNLAISVGSIVRVRLIRKVFDETNNAYFGYVDVLDVLS